VEQLIVSKNGRRSACRRSRIAVTMQIIARSQSHQLCINYMVFNGARPTKGGCDESLVGAESARNWRSDRKLAWPH
jgi:hypothetical protein